MTERRYQRPESVTREDLMQWFADADGDADTILLVQHQMRELWPRWEHPDFREVYAAGEWLRREVMARGCDRDAAGAICFANGQRSVFFDDPWQVAIETLQRFENGDVDEPGLELADRLHDEYFPEFSRRWGPPNLAAARRRVAAMREAGSC